MTPAELDALDQAVCRDVAGGSPDYRAPSETLALVTTLRAAWAERDAYREAVDAWIAYDLEAHEEQDYSGMPSAPRRDRALAALRALGWRPEGER